MDDAIGGASAGAADDAVDDASVCDETCVRATSDVSTAVGIGWRVAAWAALARACASGAGAAWPFSTSAIELKDNKRPRAPPRNQRTPAVSEQVMVPVTSSCQLSVAVDAQSTDLCRAGATSRYGERCAQLPWCAHPSSDVWRPLAQPLSTISTHVRRFLLCSRSHCSSIPKFSGLRRCGFAPEARNFLGTRHAEKMVASMTFMMSKSSTIVVGKVHGVNTDVKCAILVTIMHS